jgi:hypothetical protein
MSSKELSDRMARALEVSGLAYPVSNNFGEDRIAILCRVSKESEPRWVEMITNVLIGASASLKGAVRWQCHICRHYFLKEVNGGDKLVWGWNFSIQAKEMSLALDAIIRIMKGQPMTDHPTSELTEFPLRPHSKSGKLAHNIGTSDFHPAKSGGR